jgi:hypothetical protein
MKELIVSGAGFSYMICLLLHLNLFNRIRGIEYYRCKYFTVGLLMFFV